jgi:type IV secretory pathway VirD2 relaxase
MRKKYEMSQTKSVLDTQVSAKKISEDIIKRQVREMEQEQLVYLQQQLARNAEEYKIKKQKNTELMRETLSQQVIEQQTQKRLGGTSFKIN